MSAATPRSSGCSSTRGGGTLEGAVFLLLALVLVAAIVLVGLSRNQGRHERLIDYRKQLVELLQLPPLADRPDLARGRQIYAALFVVGRMIGAVMLTSLLASPP